MYHVHKNKLNFVALTCLFFMFFLSFSFFTSYYFVHYTVFSSVRVGMGEEEEGVGTSLNFAFENFKYISISTYK
jgi:hypothetical protein